MGFPKSWRTLEIEQQCRFGFTADKVDLFVDSWTSVQDYAYILHDKDIKADGSPKEPHIHLMIRFTGPTPTENILARAKSVFGNDTTVTISQMEKCKKWTSAIAYLTHSNAKNKHQYADDEVYSNYPWTSDRDLALEESGDARLAEIQALIDSEVLRGFNIPQYMDMAEYDKYKKKIDNYFDYVSLRKLQDPNRNIDVMYVQGESGTGKTTFAKSFCARHGFSYIVSSGSNDPLQDYNGQDALIIDDFRPRGWHMDDLLKLLDNNTGSSAKSRYHNKQMFFCKLIVLTSVVSLDEIWSNLADEDEKFKEPIQQLLRRVGIRATVLSKKIYIDIGDRHFIDDNPVAKMDKAVNTRNALDLVRSYGFQSYQPEVKYNPFA